MRLRHLTALLFLLAMPIGLQAADDPSAALMLYNGSWQVNRQDAPKPDTLISHCAKIGRFVACDQSVDGGLSALLIFIPRADKPGHFYTQNVRPEGRATSRGDLEINGDVWIFTNTWDEGGHTTYYRTTNTFSGKNKITFEQAESSNNKDWKVTNTGVETRIAFKK